VTVRARLGGGRNVTPLPTYLPSGVGTTLITRWGKGDERDSPRRLPSGREFFALGYELWFASRSFDAPGSPTLVVGVGLLFERGL
jgi:hypothetical protein